MPQKVCFFPFCNCAVSSGVDLPQECFLLVARGNLSGQNLGYVSRTAQVIEVGVTAQDSFQIVQSPGLLNSNRKDGTTGAVLWGATVFLARWLSKPDTFLWTSGLLKKDSKIVELGCGASGLLPLSLSTLMTSGTYLLTDVDYMMDLVEVNLDANRPKGNPKRRPKPTLKIDTMPLNWETDSALNVLSVFGKESNGIDLVLACDCIYNEFLIEPFVSTCVDLCRLRSDESPGPTVVLVVQQLRSASVLEAWLEQMMKTFTLFRIPDDILYRMPSVELSPHIQRPYAAHLAVLK